jgi:hypothetical protein
MVTRIILALAAVAAVAAVADARPIEPKHIDPPPVLHSPVEIIVEPPPVRPVRPVVRRVKKAYDETPPTPSKLGFRIGLGPIPLHEHRLMVVGLGLAVEHHLAGKWRILGEYEYVWLSDMDSERGDDLAHNGHRFHTGLRRVLADATLKQVLRFYVDGELGGGLMTASVPSSLRMDAAVLPHAFAGIRFGYNFIQKDNKASRSWDAEFLLRAIAVPDGVGLAFGIGMAWD